MKLILPLLLLSSTCFAQSDTARLPRVRQRAHTVRLLLGGSLQGTRDHFRGDYIRGFFEGGLLYTHKADARNRTGPTFVTGPSVEVSPSLRTIWGFKYGVWGTFHALVAGVQAVYYTDFEERSVKIRPEIGLGSGNYPFRLSIGYNIPTAPGPEFPTLQQSGPQVSMNVLLKLLESRKRVYDPATGAYRKM
jgi:hypothetical protein